jgi:hypothetical protein
MAASRRSLLGSIRKLMRRRLPAAYGQEDTDRHQDEADRPLQSDGMRWSAEQAELIYDSHRYDLA